MIRDPGARIAGVRRLALLLATLAAALAAPAAAAPFSVRLGLDRIVVDAPPGFSDTTDLASPRLQDLAATLTSESNRILVFALTDADHRHFTLGDQLEARRYMIAVTPRASERERITREQFEALAAESLKDLGEVNNPPDLVKYLADKPIGRATLLGELRREPGVISVMQALRLPPIPAAAMFDSPRQQYQVLTTTLLLVRGKTLRLSVFSLFAGPADVEWLKSTTQRWTDDLLRLNR